MIKLGEAVQDKITGFKGIAVARIEYLNGCIQYNVAPKVNKNNKIEEEIGIDEQCLKIIGKKIKIKKEIVGGRNRKSISMRGH